MHAAASSSVSVSSNALALVFGLFVVIQEIEQTSPGVYKLTPEAGSAFFLRAEYFLQDESLNFISRFTCRLCPQSEEPEPVVEEDILYASLCYAAESAAMTYLARAEQYRVSLAKKLLAKGIDKNVIKVALNHLEEVGYLDDYRFAGAWLRNRSIDHAEGRTRLEAELFSRGVKREDAKRALDEYCASVDEESVCRRALEKLLRKKVPSEKHYAALVRLGFSSSTIRSILSGSEC